MRIYLDEAGYTGSDLLSRDQPIYTLASVSLADERAKALVAAHFPNHQAKELRHSALYFRRRGREQLLALLKDLATIERSASVVVAHKEAVLLGLLVDFWIEVYLYREGVNLYENGANIALVNVTYFTLEALLGTDGRREFLRRFQVMMRDRTVFAHESFWDTVEGICRDHPDFADLFGMYLVSGRKLGIKHLYALPKDTLDLGDYGLLQTVSHWRVQTNEPLIVVHDNNTRVEAKKAMWDAIISGDAAPAKLGQDRRTIQFPLNATLEFEDSKAALQLQLADLVAGATATAFAPSAGASVKHPEYSQALKDSDLLKPHLIGGVWPTGDVTPEDLGTAGPVLGDSTGYIAELIAKRKKE